MWKEIFRRPSGRRLHFIAYDFHISAECPCVLTARPARMLEEELAKREDRIRWLEDREATFDSENRYFGFVDRRGKSRFYDEDGNTI